MTKRLQLALLAIVVALGLGTGVANAVPFQEGSESQDPVTVDTGPQTNASHDTCPDDPEIEDPEGCCTYEPGSFDDRYVRPVEKATGLDLCERERLVCVAVQIIDVGACVEYPSDGFYDDIAKRLGWD